MAGIKRHFMLTKPEIPFWPPFTFAAKQSGNVETHSAPLTPTTPCSPDETFQLELTSHSSACILVGKAPSAEKSSLLLTQDLQVDIIPSNKAQKSPSSGESSGAACTIEDAVDLTPCQLAVLLEPMDRRPSGVADLASLRPGGHMT